MNVERVRAEVLGAASRDFSKVCSLLVVPAVSGCYKLQVSVRRAVHSLALGGPALTCQAWYAKGAVYLLPSWTPEAYFLKSA